MNILFVAHNFPYPLDDGIRLHVFYLLKYLSRAHTIHFLSFSEKPVSEESLAKIKPFCSSVTVIEHQLPKQFLKRLWSTLFAADPFCVYQLESGDMSRKIKELLASHKIDAVHLDFPPMGQYVDCVADSLPKVFFPHDSMSLLFERNIAKEKNIFRKFYTWVQAVKMKRFERRMLPLFDQTVVVSPLDKDVLLNLSPHVDITANPNGVDADYFSPRPELEQENILLFRGVMNFFPNEDAVQYFAKDVMPLIWKKNPDAQFRIVGPFPTEDVKNLMKLDGRIKVTGFADDIRDPMGQATVIVSPMRIGSGIKNKILESFSMAKAVVATSLSLPGIDAQSDLHLKIGDSAESLAEQCLLLLSHPQERKRLGVEAQKLVAENYSWQKHANIFSEVYERARRAH